MPGSGCTLNTTGLGRGGFHGVGRQYPPPRVRTLRKAGIVPAVPILRLPPTDKMPRFLLLCEDVIDFPLKACGTLSNCYGQRFRMNWLRRFLRSEDGPTAVEYAVMLAMIILVCFLAIQGIGSATASSYSNSAKSITTAMSS